MGFRHILPLGYLLMAMLPREASANDYLLSAARIIDVATGEVSEPQNILVQNGEIVSIDANASQSVTNMINAEGKYVVPGFTEMHAHIPVEFASRQARDDLMFLFTAYGVTTLRGMLGHPSHLALREKLDSNRIAGPRLITSGPSLNGRSIHSPQAAVDTVSAQKARGYDFLKIHPGLSNDSFTALALRANQLEIPFAGHVTREVGLIRSVQLGQATIDHLDGVLEELARRSGVEDADPVLLQPGFFGSQLVSRIEARHIQPLAEQLADLGAVFVPTESLMYGFLSPESPQVAAAQQSMQLVPPSLVEQWKTSRQNMHSMPGYSVDNARRFFKIRSAFINAFVSAGGSVLLGSDAPQVFNVPGDSLHDEMRLLVEAGMTEQQVLYAATVAPASFFGLAERTGTIEAGKQADFVVLDANPLENIQHTRNIAGVMSRGNWLPGAIIEKRLAQIKKRHTTN